MAQGDQMPPRASQFVALVQLAIAVASPAADLAVQVKGADMVLAG